LKKGKGLLFTKLIYQDSLKVKPHSLIHPEANALEDDLGNAVDQYIIQPTIAEEDKIIKRRAKELNNIFKGANKDDKDGPPLIKNNNGRIVNYNHDKVNELRQ